MKTNKLYISGRNAAREALFNMPQAVKHVYVERGFNDSIINRLIEKAGLEREPLNHGAQRADIKAGASTQGIVIQVSLIDIMQSFEKFLDSLAVSPKTSLVLFSGIQDPHNVGTIIRSAAAFGASGILMPQQNQSPVTAAVIKSSAGMAFQLPLISIPSVPAALTMLKKKGFKTYALAAGKQNIGDAAFASPSVFVLGNEGIGLDKATRSLCDETLSIPMHPKVESLNVAASAAVALHAWSAKHPEALA
jgi:23S rRNA (guanosine2251-2'-O)-methyltransferase